MALALKDRGLTEEVAGYGRNEERLGKAREAGIIDTFSTDASEACSGASLVVLATPPGLFLSLAKPISSVIDRDALVIDVGSVKGKLVGDMQKIIAGFVGCHPIAGGERSGFEAANASLFDSALTIITPTEETDRGALDKAEALWAALGARVQQMDPIRHDKIYAIVSHMPHLAAYAMVSAAYEMDRDSLEFAGRGFRDTTRIAMSSPELWADIFMLNRDNLLESLDSYIENLKRLGSMLLEGDVDALVNKITEGRKLREGIEDR